MSHSLNKLNSFWLWREVSSKLGVLTPAYKYWKETPNIKLHNKYVFMQKNTLPEKHEYVEDIKFVNIKKFFRELGIKVSKDSIVQLGCLKYLEFTPNSTFYNLKMIMAL